MHSCKSKCIIINVDKYSTFYFSDTHFFKFECDVLRGTDIHRYDTRLSFNLTLSSQKASRVVKMSVTREVKIIYFKC